MKRKAGIILMVAMALVLVTAVVYALPGIDNFDDAQGFLQLGYADVGTSTSNSVTGAMLGGSRDIILSLLSAPSGTGPRSSVYVNGSSLIISNDDGYVSTVEVQWDGNNSATLDTAGLGSQNLSSYGNSLWIRVLSDDLQIPVTFTVYSNGGAQSSSMTVTLPGGISSSTDIQFPFASFTGTANFADVSAIVMVIGGPGYASVDLNISAIQVSTGTPTAVSLQNVAASGQSTVLPFALGAIGLIVISTGLVISRKRKNA